MDRGGWEGTQMSMASSDGLCDKGGLGSGVSDSAVSAGSGAGSGATGGVGSIRQARLDETDQDSDSEGSVDTTQIFHVLVSIVK